MSETEPRPGTTAAVEKRVERIEEKVDNLEVRVVGVEKDLAHTRQVLELQLTAVVKGQESVSAKIDALSATFSSAQMQGAAMLGDPESTPAGRQVVAALKETRALAVAADERGQRLEKRLAYLGGALAVVVILVNLLAPFGTAVLKSWFGLP